ncbi:three-Cys-motif partner protein TcmP [Deinococcus sp. YIM 77859]|uniref:three-Cys-motif partner protein TcmP n=1 Tax=Deinococcus sp. YIM 77859 TaxID=1540221 RepID=UPI0005547A82|nr:three-Cys-motif partner protein TcmP [Deinococcus sp. YIM 77859]
MPTPDNFFNDSQRLASKIKTDIVVKYFKPWLDIMAKRGPKVGYVDLFSGPGKFISEEGEFPSTPLKILDLVQQNPGLTSTLHLHFNDANPAHAASLREAMTQHPAWPLIRERVTITSERVTAEQVRSWILPYPALYFLDPFGYGGFTFDDLNAIVRQHGNDLLFFFNYNRFNPELKHPEPKIRRQPEVLLGTQSYQALQGKLEHASTPSDRQQIITDHLWSQLERGGVPQHYVVPFEFKFHDRDRTSHYLVFVSKNQCARKIIREVMAGLRTDRAGGSFEFNPHATQGSLFDGHFALGDELLKMFAGQTLTVKQVIAQHDLAFPRAPYVEKDYKNTLKQLRQSNCLTVIKSDGKTVPPHQMPDTALVTFR